MEITDSIKNKEIKEKLGQTALMLKADFLGIASMDGDFYQYWFTDDEEKPSFPHIELKAFMTEFFHKAGNATLVNMPDLKRGDSSHLPVMANLSRLNFKSLIAIPLYQDDHLLGFATCISKDPKIWSPIFVHLLEKAGLATLSVHLMELSDRKYRMLFDKTSENIIIINEKLDIIDANRSALSTLNYSQESMKKLNFSQDLLKGMDEKKAREIFGKLEKGEIFDTEIKLEKSNGDIRIFQGLFTPVKCSFGKTFFEIILKDITEMLRIHKEFDELNKYLDERVKARTNHLEFMIDELKSFNYSVSHDLKAPLRIIKGFCQALKEDCNPILDENLNDYVNRIQNAAEKMSSFVDTLMNLSLMADRKLDISRIDITKMCKDIFEELSFQFKDRIINLSIESDIFLHGDPTLIRIMLFNLLQNAFKYTKNQKVAEIKINNIGNVEGQFCICDNGIGFDPLRAHEIFTPFLTLHNRDFYPGNGIGLALVKKITEKHNAKIFPSSVPMEGSCFFLDFNNSFNL